MKRYVLAGYSAAAVSAIRAIRSIDKAGRITVVSREVNEPYSKVLLTHYIAGHCTKDKLFLLTQEERSSLDYEVLPGVEAESTDTENRLIRCSDGQKLTYDELLIATGADPVIPAEAECLGVKYSGLRTLEDAEIILSTARDGGRIVISGGGLVGVKLACALNSIGAHADIVIGSDRVLSKNTDREASLRIAAHMRGCGIGIHTLTNVVTENEHPGTVTLSNGETLKCALLVYAKGVKPSTGFISGFSDKRGVIPVDGHMQTAEPHVFAAGDAAAAYDILFRQDKNIAIWPHAVEQGRIAGKNMAGEEAVYRGSLSRNALEILGLPYITIGTLEENTERGEYAQISAEKNLYRKLIFRGDRLIGALLLGDVDDAGILQARIWKDTAEADLNGGEI